MSNQTRTIDQALAFLNKDYDAYHVLPTDKKQKVDWWNGLVLEREESTITLRDLYIELMLCDTMINFQAKANPRSGMMSKMNHKKINLVKQIHYREKLQERLVPDPEVMTAAQDCQDDEDKLIETLLQWTDAEDRDKLRKRCQRGRDKPKWLFKLVQTMSQQNVVTKLTQVENFKNFVCMTECLQRFVALRKK